MGTCTNKESVLTKLNLNLKRNLPKAATSTKLTHSCSESNTSTTKSLLNSDNVLPPVKPRSLVSTTDYSKSPTDKSMSGVVKLWSVSNKSSCASTQDTTNTQLKLKSTNSMISSENKPRSGSVSKKTNSTVKSNASTKNGTPASNNGNCAPN